MKGCRVCFDQLSSQLKRKDGRIVILLAFVLYFSSIFLASLFTDYAAFWEKYLKVSTSKPAFLDTHHLTAGIECTRKGYDVLKTNPCEPNKLPMDYPRIWLHLTKIGIDKSHSAYIGIGFALIFFASVFLIAGRLTVSEGFLYSVILCSPCIMLGVETGNTDLLMFAILTPAVLLLKKYERYAFFAYLLFFCAAILKLYPIATLISCIRERKRQAIAVFLLLFGVFAVYVYQIFPDILQMYQNATKSTYLSYGVQVLYQIMAHSFVRSGYRLTADSSTIFTVVILGLVCFLAYTLARRKTVNGLRVDFLDSFRVAAAIYIVSYSFWNNWDYRLIFLLFAVPQMLLWVRQGERLSALSRSTLAIIVVTLWISSKSPPGGVFPGANRFLLDEFLNLFLVFYFSFALLLTLPDWLKITFRLHSVSMSKESDTEQNSRFELRPAEQGSNSDTLVPG